MNSDQREWAIIFSAVMTQEFNPDISCPYLRILDEKGLYISSVTSFVGSNIFPLLHFNWVAVANADTKSPDIARKELVYGKHHSINPDILLIDVSKEHTFVEIYNIPTAR